MTRKRRISKPAPAPVATSATVYSPARATRSGGTAASLMTPPTRAKTTSLATAIGAQLTNDAPILSPPLKKRVHTRRDARAVKVQSLEDALDEQDDFDDEQRGYDGSSNTLRHNIKPDPHLPDPYKRNATVLQYKGSVYDAMLTRVRVRVVVIRYTI